MVDGNGTATIDTIKYNNIIKITSKKGRANQMNEGAKIASSDTLLFLHADTILPDDALLYINKSFEDTSIKAGAFDLSFDTTNLALKTIAKVASWRSRFTKLPYGDQAIFIKRDIFEKINGYENITLMEDVNLMQKLKKQNYQIEILNQTVITSARKWKNRGIVYTTLRNWILISLYYCGIHPNKLTRFYK